MKSLKSKTILLLLLTFIVFQAHSAGSKKPPPAKSNVEVIQLSIFDWFKF